MVRVLIFIDHYVFIAISVFFQNLGELLKKLCCYGEDIIKIKSVRGHHALLIKGIESGNNLFAVVLPCVLAHLLGSYHFVLCCTYLAENHSRSKLLFRDIYFSHNGLYHALAVVRVVDREISAVTHCLYLAAEYPYTGGMESRGVDVERLLAKHCRKTLAKLACRLVRECYREDIPRFYGIYCYDIAQGLKVVGFSVSVFAQKINVIIACGSRLVIVSVAEIDEVGDTVYYNCGFSAACTCENKQGRSR